MKRLVTTIGIALLIGALAVPVLAYGPGWGRGHHMMGWGGGPGDCPAYGGLRGTGEAILTDEQRSQLSRLHQEFWDKTAPLRNEIWAKRAQRNTLMNTSNPDKEKILTLQGEINELSAKIARERINYQLEERKINPDARFGMGYGRGFGHPKRGWGLGCPGWDR